MGHADTHTQTDRQTDKGQTTDSDAAIRPPPNRVYYYMTYFISVY